jgi:hypothetical protein
MQDLGSISSRVSLYIAGLQTLFSQCDTSAEGTEENFYQKTNELLVDIAVE